MEEPTRSAADDTYLATQVFTATPQKLQLMLIEGALRSSLRARQLRAAGDKLAAGEHLIKAQELAGALMNGMDRDANPALIDRIAAIYLFIFRNLMEANMSDDDRKLDEAIHILEIERETWRQVCDKLSGQSATADQFVESHRHDESVPPPASSLWGGDSQGLPTTGFSLEV